MSKLTEIERINLEYDNNDRYRVYLNEQIYDVKGLIDKWESRLAEEKDPSGRAQIFAAIAQNEARLQKLNDDLQACEARRDELGAEYKAEQAFQKQRAQAAVPEATAAPSKTSAHEDAEKRHGSAPQPGFPEGRTEQWWKAKVAPTEEPPDEPEATPSAGGGRR